MDELKGLIRDLDGDVAGLRKEAGAREVGQRKRDKRRDVLIGGVIIVLLASSVFIWRFVAYSNCTTARSRALSGPANDRVSFFLQAYTEAAGAKMKPLTPAKKAAVISDLDRDRREFSAIPDHAALVKSPDTQLLAYRDLLRSLRANATYKVQAAQHPVCSLWGF